MQWKNIQMYWKNIFLFYQVLGCDIRIRQCQKTLSVIDFNERKYDTNHVANPSDSRVLSTTKQEQKILFYSY